MSETQTPTIEVVLTPQEILYGAQVGILKFLETQKHKAQQRYGAKQEDRWRFTIEGALGELAVAKHLGIFWSGGRQGDEDLPGFEVRTRSRPDYDLIVHPEDRDESRFVLVTGALGHYHLVGWILGKDAKFDGWWKDPAGGRPAFFVPQYALRPMSEART
jgi:hypothetical protein